MIYGNEDSPITDYIWTVPYKFYRLTSITLYIKSTGQTAPAFEVTFSPDPAHTSGWPDETYLFGNTNGFSGTTKTFSNEITEIRVCVDDIWPAHQPFGDFEKFYFKETDGTETSVGADYNCNGNGSNDDY